MTSRSRYYWLAAIILLTNLGIGWHFHAAVQESSDDTSAYAALDRFTTVMRYIRRFYVNPEKAEYDTLVNGAVDGMIKSLDDPFSSYIPPQNFEAVNERTDGQFAGIGVVIDTRDGRVTVVEPFRNSPGERAGLIPGDQILEVDGISVIGHEINDVVDRIKGEVGTDVNITFYRPATKEQVNVDITRAIVEVDSVRHVDMLTDEIGYLHITQFTKRTPAETHEALMQLVTRDMQALIIDVRDNPGGLLDSANDVCSLFLPEGTLVCFTEGRDPEENDQYYVTPTVPHDTVRHIVILTNAHSASGAEILAGCLGDNRRALLVGEKTFGKGSVQTIYPLAQEKGGGGIRLTVAHYYTPGARVIHGKGIRPHVPVAIEDAELASKLRANRASYGDALEFADDPQVTKAIEILNSLISADPAVPAYPLPLDQLATDPLAIAPLPKDPTKASHADPDAPIITDTAPAGQLPN